jgi:uncharacterized membrane protein
MTTIAAEPAVTRAPLMHRPLGRALQRRRRLRAGILQLGYILAAVGLGLLVPRIPIGFSVPSTRTIEALFAVGAGIVTFIGIVYSLLFLVVQFGSTTFTPRLNLFRDAPIVLHAFGFFTGVLVFSFTAAFAVGGNDETSGLVPLTLVLLLLTSIGLFRALQTGAFKSIQLASVLAQVIERGREVIDGVYPARSDDWTCPAREDLPAVTTSIRWTHGAAVIQHVDVPRLLECAERADAVVELRFRPGETILQGSLLALVRGGDDTGLEEEVLATVNVGLERTFEQDPAFALRVLVDIALRALSPALNDPTTAVQATDGIDSLLRELSMRELNVGDLTDASGSVRLVLPLPTWDEYLELALDEIISMRAGSMYLQRRLLRLLEQLLEIAPPKHQASVQARLSTLRNSPG